MDRNMRPLNGKLDSTRWTDMNAIRSNLGMSKNATQQDVINRLSGGDVINTKYDYTSSSWDTKQNVVGGTAGRYVKIEMHYAKGAMVQFSPTRKEGEVVGARNKPQRYSNGRIERVTTPRGKTVDALVIDCYVDS